MRTVNRRQIRADDILRKIWQDIVSQEKTDEQWPKIESDDRYQESPYIGGYNAIEQEFWFSFYEGQKEYWFGFSLSIACRIANGDECWLDLIEPDSEGLR